MGSSLTASALADAAERVSSAPTSYRRLAGGAASKEVEWDTLRGRISRALLADPDLVTYFAYLVSNRACRYAQETATALSAAVVAIEGWKYRPATVPEPTKLQQVLASLSSRTNLSSEDVARCTHATETYIENSALPAMTKGTRLQVQGQEAVTVYQKEVVAALDSLRRLAAALSATTSKRVFPFESLRAYALQVPYAALSTTAGLLDATALSDFVVQLAAAKTAVEAVGRPVDLEVRMRLGDDAFPEEETAEVTFSAGVATEITPATAPILLGIKSGDLVQNLSGTAEVREVGESSFTLTASTIKSATALVVRSAAYAEWQALVEELSPIYTELPSVEALRAELRRKEDPSAARIRELMERLYNLAAELDIPSADATAALERVGGTATVVASAAEQLLRGFSPVFGSATEQTGDRILTDLEAAGLDYAVELLYYGRISQLLDSSAGQLSRSGRVSTAASSLGVYTGAARDMG